MNTKEFWGILEPTEGYWFIDHKGKIRMKRGINFFAGIGNGKFCPITYVYYRKFLEWVDELDAIQAGLSLNLPADFIDKIIDCSDREQDIYSGLQFTRERLLNLIKK